MNKVVKLIFLVVAIGAISLLVRLPGLGEFMTVDEENWMVRSAEFYHKLLSGDPGGTYITTHPGATAMWLIGGGEVIQEKRVGFKVDSSNLKYFRLSATLPIALTISLLIMISILSMASLFGTSVAIASGLLLATDPYLLGLSQIAHLDALQGMLMLNGLLAALLYVKKNKKSLLILAGVFTGLALGVKLVLAFWLVLVVMILLVSKYWRSLLKNQQHVISSLGLFLGVAMLTFYGIWPALWVKDDLTRYVVRDTGNVVTQEHVSLSTSENPISPKTFYLRTVLGRTTPYTLLLTLSALIAVTYYSVRKKKVPDILWLILYSIGYLTLITLAAKKGDRYALPALVMFPVIAGWAAVTGWTVLRQKINLTKRTTVEIFLILALLVIAVPLLWYPHNIAYNNPLFKNVRPLSQQGWGEGLEEAAQWLNSHPLAEKMTIASWYPSVTATYFKGKTFSLSARDDDRVGFIVTYRNMTERARDTIASDVLDEMKKREPVHVVKINNVPYAWIYNILGVKYFNKNIGELKKEIEVGQTIEPKKNGWGSIEIGFATFSSRGNNKDVVLHIKRNIDDKEDIRTVQVNASDIVDNEWHRFEFEPIKNSSGNEYYISLTSPDSYTGNAVAVRYIDSDILPGNMFLLRKSLRDDQSRYDFIRKGDIAYRIIE